MNLPNALTFLRVGLACVVCGLLQIWPDSWAACVVFAVAATTDFFDGYVAHKTNGRTALGAALDPLADKILVLMVLFFLAGLGRLSGWALWPCALMMARDVGVMGLRGLLGTDQLPVIRLAKGKTALQCLAVGLCTVPPFPAPCPGFPGGIWQSVQTFAPGVALALLWIAAALSVGSAGIYTMRAVHLCRAGAAQKLDD